MLTAIDLVLHQVGILRMVAMSESPLVAAVLGHRTTVSPPISEADAEALHQADKSLRSLRSLIGRLRENEPGWQLAPRDPTVTRKSREHDFVRAAVMTCRRLGAPEPTGPELAALAILRDIDKPLEPMPRDLARGARPNRAPRTQAQVVADRKERDRRGNKWANTLRRFRNEEVTHTTAKS
jgi:hypothetical protein